MNHPGKSVLHVPIKTDSMSVIQGFGSIFTELMLLVYSMC